MSFEPIVSQNPATLETLGEVPNQNEEFVQAAVQRAGAMQKSWSELGFDKRREYLLKFRDIILENIDELAELISNENGKPIQEAIGNDILPVLDLTTYFAKSAKKLLKKEKIRLGKWGLLGRKSHLEFYPLGVVGIIAPWNYPFSIPVGEIVMALVVGNTVVFKPSEHTPLVGQAIVKYFDQAGLPEGVLEIVTGDGTAGAALVESGVNKIAFTGSVATGKRIMEAASKNLTPLTLELGGKDPMIVFADADLDVASSAAVWGAFSNSGQICASVERLYVEDSIKDEFTKLVVEKTNAIQQGPGQRFDVDMGAMTAGMQLQKVSEHVDDARERGAQILTGGERLEGYKGWFYKPTVLTDVDHSFPIVAEETFGPIMPIMGFASEFEVIEKANDSPYALNAYVWSKDRTKARRVASNLVAGTVNINESVFTHALPQTPWGGPKLSGIGRTHGALGLLDLVEVRHVHENTKPKKINFFWWFGYSEEKVDMLKTLSVALFGRGTKRLGAFFKFVKMSLKAKVR